MFDSKFVALTFSDLSIKAAQLRKSGSSYKALFLAERRLTPNIVFNGKIIDPEQFRENLKAFYLENYPDFKGKEAVIGINDQETFLSIRKIEAGKRITLEQLKPELEGKLPFEWSSTKINLHQEGDLLQITAINGADLAQIQSLFTEVGFRVKLSLPLTLALCDLVKSIKKPSLLLSIEENNLVFCAVVNSLLIFSSTLYLKGQISANTEKILSTLSEIIESSYQKLFPNSETLNSIFLLGREAEILKGFLGEQKYNVEVLPFIDKIAYQYRNDLSNSNRVLVLASVEPRKFKFDSVAASSISKTRSLRAPSRKVLFAALSLFLIVGLLFGLYKFFPKDLFERKKESNQQNTASSSATASAKVATETPKLREATAPATPATKRSSFTIQILNGSGIANAASTASSFLSSKGYKIVSTGNADSFNYLQTQVRVKKSKRTIQQTLTSDLDARYDLVVGSPLPESEQFDIQIVVGKN